jgi:hypothetical protein
MSKGNKKVFDPNKHVRLTIDNVSFDVVKAIDEHARNKGVTRNSLLRPVLKDLAEKYKEKTNPQR